MTISSTNRKAGPYVGTGLVSAFPFAFKVFSGFDVLVVRSDSGGAETVLTLNSDYTVSLNANQNANPGGTITLPAPLPSGFALTASSALPYLQPTDLTNNGGFYPKVITNSLDRLTVFCQQLYEQLSRSLKLAISVPPGVKVTLPVPVPYQVLGWDSTGTQIVNADPAYASAISGDLANVSDLAKGVAMVGGAGRVVDSIATLRTLPKTGAKRAFVIGYYAPADGGGGAYYYDATDTTSTDNGGSIIVASDGGRWKLAPAGSISIKQFGAKGDNAANDTAAFEALVTYCAATGATGIAPAGTYLIDPSNRTFSANLPFIIRGEGRGATILKNSNTAASFIYWTGPNGVAFENLKIDGAFTGLPSTPASGGTLVLVNSNDNTVRGVDFVNIWRVALMIYNDHQTTTTNVYGGHVIDNCRAYGPSNYSNNVGPSAFLVADVINSSITNCYINNIGLYGYEFKNDCSNTLISNCIAEDTYYPLYYGGDGAHTELGYVKNSLIENCVVRRPTSGCAITMGLAWNNTARNISIDSAGVASNFPVYISNGSNNNSITGIDLKGRSYEAVTVRTGSNGNVVEFTNINDGAYSGRGSTGIANDCSNNTVIFGNRDSAQQMFLESHSFNNNTVIDRKYNLENYDASVKPLKKIRFGDVGLDNLPSTSNGLAILGSTADYFQVTAQDSAYQHFGSFSKYNIAGVRYRLTDGVKFESLYNGSATVTFITDPSNGYYPQADNAQKLGLASNRWSTVYAGTGTINTSDAREKQQIRELSNQERAVALRLKNLVRAFKFNDAVEAKGDKARVHCGVIAQDVKAAFEAEGLVAEDYAIFCYDEWAEQQEVVETWDDEFDEDGGLRRPAGSRILDPYRPAGNRYGVRYEELFAFILGAS